jgi:hypothetical protein
LRAWVRIWIQVDISKAEKMFRWPPRNRMIRSLTHLSHRFHTYLKLMCSSLNSLAWESSHFRIWIARKQSSQSLTKWTEFTFRAIARTQWAILNSKMPSVSSYNTLNNTINSKTTFPCSWWVRARRYLLSILPCTAPVCMIWRTTKTKICSCAYFRSMTIRSFFISFKMTPRCRMLST